MSRLIGKWMIIKSTQTGEKTMTAENTVETEDTAESYREMSWQKLRALMAAEGQEWKDKDHAIEYLERLDGIGGPDEDGTVEDAAPDETEADSQAEADTEASAGPAEDPKVDAGEDDVVTGDDLVDAPDDEQDAPCFDPDEKHGVITGETNARYWQNGCHFDGQGKYLKPEEVT